MATLHGFDHPETQKEMGKANAGTWDPRVDINIVRPPERMIHIFSISPRSFTIDRPPLWIKLHLRACPKDERYVAVAHVPDPLMQTVHNTENGRQRGEAHDGMRCAIDLLNPNNPTNNPDWDPAPELKAFFSTSRGSDLFAQGLFLSLNEVPTEIEIAKAEKRRERYYKALIAQADELEAIDRKELMVMLKTEEGTDLRMALDYFGEQRDYHKPMIATRECPNCGEMVKKSLAYHKPKGIDALCVIDWRKTVAAGVKTKDEVPEDARWWNEDVSVDVSDAGEDSSEDAAPKTPKGRGGRKGTQQASE